MSGFTYRVHVIVPIANETQANTLAASVDTDSGGANTFGSVRLSATGSEPATHTGCSTQAQQAQRDQIAQMALAYSWAHVFEAPTTFDEAIASMGLQRIVTPPGA